MQDLDLVAARSVSKKHANATGFQPKSSWLGRRRSKPTVSVGCASAYAGLAPSPWKSGSIDQEQGISKAGNPRLRTTMVELAWTWVRYTVSKPKTIA